MKAPISSHSFFENALDKKDLTRMGSTLALMPSKYGVGNNPMKVSKGWVAYGSCFRTN